MGIGNTRHRGHGGGHSGCRCGRLTCSICCPKNKNGNGSATGPQGPQGPEGPQGPAGPEGTPGATGPCCPTEDTGVLIKFSAILASLSPEGNDFPDAGLGATASPPISAELGPFPAYPLSDDTEFRSLAVTLLYAGQAEGELRFQLFRVPAEAPGPLVPIGVPVIFASVVAGIQTERVTFPVENVPAEERVLLRAFTIEGFVHNQNIFVTATAR